MHLLMLFLLPWPVHLSSLSDLAVPFVVAIADVNMPSDTIDAPSVAVVDAVVAGLSLPSSKLKYYYYCY